MLSRVADALFWMSRYLERAEHVTRLLDVTFHLELDLRSVETDDRQLHWASLATILQQPLPQTSPDDVSDILVRSLTFDLENPVSIMSCVSRSRSNARSIRGSISADMWRELNKLYWQLSDAAFRQQSSESPHEFYQAVESGAGAFQGICDATLDHDEGWHFIQLGKYLERADKTLRTLDVESRRLATLDPRDLPLSNLRWGGVLRSCRAYEAYQRHQVGRVEPEGVVEFLLLHPTSPRSVRFALESAAQSLAAIAGGNTGSGGSVAGGLGKADRLLGRALSDLRYVVLDDLADRGLHSFLSTALGRCVEVSQAIQEQYSPQ